jgi:hypothetical protein
MEGNTLLLYLSVLTSLLVIALGPRLPRMQGSHVSRKALPDLRWVPPAAFRRTRIALLVISAALLFVALGPHGLGR